MLPVTERASPTPLGRSAGTGGYVGRQPKTGRQLLGIMKRKSTTTIKTSKATFETDIERNDAVEQVRKNTVPRPVVRGLVAYAYFLSRCLITTSVFAAAHRLRKSRRTGSVARAEGMSCGTRIVPSSGGLSSSGVCDSLQADFGSNACSIAVGWRSTWNLKYRRC